MNHATLDANEAVASVAYRLSETIAIYPITPSSPMAEWCDEWSVAARPNLWKTVPHLVQMQSEAGVAGTVHGALQAGTLTTTFTASQGLLLMIPNLYKIVGELLPFCFHVTARTVATHALSIFGDHSDVMACRQTGVAMLASNSVQEAQDMACIAHAATLAGRVPVMHFFDGFRTSHEVAKIDLLDDATLAAMVEERWIRQFRERALSPERPDIRGTAQNPDVFFQCREAANRFHDELPSLVQCLMDRFAEITGRAYELFQYSGDPCATRVIVAMGSGAETAEETSRLLNAGGERTGVLKVRLYRPFSVPDFINVLPINVEKLAVLDRTKEPGAVGEPLYVDILAALSESRSTGFSRFEREPAVIGGRYGLSSKEFDPAMAKAVFDELKKDRPKRHFTVGINDDVSRLSLSVDETFSVEGEDVYRAVFFGLGSDGTVGANKNTIKIIGEKTANYAQGYFVYDSKKSGTTTVSHLRFSPSPIASHYLIQQANFVACHHLGSLERGDLLAVAAPGATVLLNSSQTPAGVWNSLPQSAQGHIQRKNLKVWTIDAAEIARASGVGGRINTIMQTAFFALSEVLPIDRALEAIKSAIEKSYGRKGGQIVERNCDAVDAARAGLREIRIPADPSIPSAAVAECPDGASDFFRRVTSVLIAGEGDRLPVSAFPVDGIWPTGTAKWEKRGIGEEIPVWDPDLCIQCNKCALVCPHACIRPGYYDHALLTDAPPGFLTAEFRSQEVRGARYTLQIAPDDCTGCSLCVQACPVKDRSNPQCKAISMQPAAERRTSQREHYQYFLGLPVPDRMSQKPEVKSSQFLEPLFEYSGACAGCGETPYLKLLTQLFGDRAVIANATGCSSIFGGNLPTTPYCANSEGRGPAWSNSLFEDNAEYGLGLRFAIDKRAGMARELLARLSPQLGDRLVSELLNADQSAESGIRDQRIRVRELRQRLVPIADPDAWRLEVLADDLVKKSVWIVGGDGWAYDIGFGGLDHVMALNRDVNILVLDTEVYSNTGGQQSKSTPAGACAKFAMSGKTLPKKDLGRIAMSYGSVYVARIAMGAKDSQTVKVFAEAESYPGTSLIIAYSHCIAHGYAMRLGLDQQKRAVDSGAWPLYRFDPRRALAGQPPLQLDSAPGKIPVVRYTENELRFRMIEHSQPERHAQMQRAVQNETDRRWKALQEFSQSQTPLADQP